ncbi:hypothetical protein ABK040_012536 [Willaertia magna]
MLIILAYAAYIIKHLGATDCRGERNLQGIFIEVCEKLFGTLSFKMEQEIKTDHTENDSGKGFTDLICKELNAIIELKLVTHIAKKTKKEFVTEEELQQMSAKDLMDYSVGGLSTKGVVTKRGKVSKVVEKAWKQVHQYKTNPDYPNKLVFVMVGFCRFLAKTSHSDAVFELVPVYKGGVVYYVLEEI